METNPGRRKGECLRAGVGWGGFVPRIPTPQRVPVPASDPDPRAPPLTLPPNYLTRDYAFLRLRQPIRKPFGRRFVHQIVVEELLHADREVLLVVAVREIVASPGYDSKITCLPLRLAALKNWSPST